ncbi:MAG TPA: hypothetical protein EYP56_01310 [Planctomycetaceae bacterium]|nr:hypothetical protein [Planctomycetaceae bacterium]
MTKTYFVSDLHLLAGHSDGDRALAEIRQVAGHADVVVLGGDIFDFRWASTLTMEEAARQAVEYLRRLTGQFPGCQFHYVLGNHDYHRQFLGRLGELADGTPNLAWHRFHWRMGPNVFLHGDVMRRRMNAQRLARSRSRWLDQRQRGALRSGLYEMIVAAGLHRPIPPLVHRKRKVARRILAYLGQIGHGPEQGVRHVYFGHTHRQLGAFHYRGITFHNGGAAIKGLKYRIVRVESA